ncbi:MAG: SDR family oxidoreductase [Balneolaceae bacterium]|nr:SDR family oxidoreductase [Balneolaceae bacterium]MBO6546934.1 SDR family oxidoreductase [Balneolaceae bacterium]MBO6649294.1 SDR family oxidoreductase [Balneolaceae bacterium]
MLDFTGQTIVITGSTRGIGKEAAKLFLERGGTVYITGTGPKPSKTLEEELKAIGEFEYLQGNFSSDEGIISFIELLNLLPRIDVFINNAGINLLNEVEQISDKDYSALISVNMNAPLKISRFLAGLMKKQGYGRIVNVASIWSVITRARRAIYSMSKNAINGLTQTMGVELAKYGVLVNSISPGFTLTELTETTNTKEELKKIGITIPINRLADPSEIGMVILFLSSKENSYMTGQNIVVDGGFTNV